MTEPKEPATEVLGINAISLDFEQAIIMSRELLKIARLFPCSIQANMKDDAYCFVFRHKEVTEEAQQSCIEYEI